jgi:hypothetical protein
VWHEIRGRLFVVQLAMVEQVNVTCALFRSRVLTIMNAVLLMLAAAAFVAGFIATFLGLSHLVS